MRIASCVARPCGLVVASRIETSWALRRLTYSSRFSQSLPNNGFGGCTLAAIAADKKIVVSSFDDSLDSAFLRMLGEVAEDEGCGRTTLINHVSDSPLEFSNWDDRCLSDSGKKPILLEFAKLCDSRQIAAAAIHARIVTERFLCGLMNVHRRLLRFKRAHATAQTSCPPSAVTVQCDRALGRNARGPSVAHYKKFATTHPCQ